jgi:molecular chaperone DnaJ
MAKRDYYEVLGLSRGASDQDIKSAFRRLAKDCHPDRNSGDKSAEQRFKELNEAY